MQNANKLLSGILSVTDHLNEDYSYHSAASYRRKHAAGIRYACTGTALGKKKKTKKTRRVRDDLFLKQETAVLSMTITQFNV